jgi:hypothetical protein
MLSCRKFNLGLLRKVEGYLSILPPSGLVCKVFGSRILQCIIGLYQGGFDYLEHMQDDLLLSIMSYLPIKDVAQLAKTTSPEGEGLSYALRNIF